MGSFFKKTTCPLDCPDTCGIVAEVVDGRIVSLQGDKEHPYTRGVLCRKMRNYHERVYADKRILFPMRRSGQKGAGRFERISWTQAYDILADKILQVQRQYGGESIIPFVYAGNMGAINRFAGYPLFHKIGASRMEETICSAAAGAGWRSQCGDITGAAPETAEDAELIIIWGSNTKVTNMHFWPYVAAAKKKGGRLVVIDPYRNQTAQSADIYLQVSPGGDSALALGTLKLLIESGAVDREFITLYCSGFDHIEKYLRQTDIADFVRQSGVSEEGLQALATLCSTHKKTFIRIGIGMTRNSRAGMTIRSITSLAAALGLFDGKNGRGVLLTSGAFKGDKNLLTWPQLSPRQTRLFNMVQLANCLHDKAVPAKLLFVYNANPLSVAPDASLIRQALKDDDLFTVVHEQIMTPTARYADLLLPATTFLENRDIYTAYGHFYLTITDPVIEPLGEAKSNFTFFQELARKLNFSEEPFQQSLEMRLEQYLLSLEGLPQSFILAEYRSAHPVLSIRCVKGEPLYGASTMCYKFALRGQHTVPEHACLMPAGEFDDADYLARFPFKLIAPPHMDLLNSTFGERYEAKLGTLFIHPDDALEYTIEEGQTVTLYNSRGWARRHAKITDATQKGLLVAEGIFWQNSEHPAGINDLTSQKLTDMGGGGTFHESRVAIIT